jgi:hypothetical protein
VEIEFAHQVRAVVVHGLHADAELGGDFLGAVAFGDELENLAFAVGEEVGGRAGGGIGDDVAQERGDGGAEVGAATGDGFEALLKFDETGGFFDEAVSAGFKHFAHEDGVFVSRENEYADVFELFADAAEKIHAVEAGELGVEHEQIGLHVEAKGVGALAVAALADQLVVRIRAEDLDEHFANGSLVFDDYESFHRHYYLSQFGENGRTLNAKRIGCRYLTVIYMGFTPRISARADAADQWDMMPVKSLSSLAAVFPAANGRRRGVAAALVACVLATAAFGAPEAPASHKKTPSTAPAANVSKLQAWKDAEAIAALAPGRSEVIGAGDSMKPVYGENTILVITKISYDELKPGMNVVYTNRRAKLVVHQTLSREAKGWRVQGINNEREDQDRVTRDNLVGVVYASLSYSDGDTKRPGDSTK